MKDGAGAVFAPGLEGVVAAETALSDVDGLAGELTIRGYSIGDIAPYATFEEMCHLLLNGRLPDAGELREFSRAMVSGRGLPDGVYGVIEKSLSHGVSGMDALRMSAGMLVSGGDEMEDSVAVISCMPTLVAAYARMSRGEEPVEPRADLGHAANYLYMITGEEPSSEFARALETYLNTVADHGLNASTFAARVIISTMSDMTSAVVGAIGALKGPLHGGAPGPALDVVFEIATSGNAEPVLREKLDRGERLMGFGHRIYKVRDPRADILSEAAERLFETDGDRELYDLALSVEQKALELLEEYKPGRKLQTNVEFYTALLLHGVGLPSELFSPTFAVARTAGWTAHCIEQLHDGRLIRPQSVYTGEKGIPWKAEGPAHREA